MSTYFGPTALRGGGSKSIRVNFGEKVDDSPISRYHTDDIGV